MGKWFRRRTPESPTGPTNMGPVVDRKVAEATGRLRTPGEDADYDLVRDAFDVTHYFLQAPRLVDNPNVDAVRNFLREGPRQRRTPHVNFSVQAYLSRHPERGQDSGTSPYLTWLREGRAAGEIGDPAIGLEKMAHVLGLTPQALADELAERRSDLQHRLRHGRLGEMFGKAAAIDPLVGDAWSEVTRPKMTPLPAPLVANQVSAVYLCHEAAGFTRARVLLVADRPGQDLEQTVLAGLAAKVDPADVVVLCTAPGGVPTSAAVRYVDLAAAIEGIDGPNAQQVLAELVRSFDAEVVVGLDSQLFLDTLTPYGKALRASERVFLGLPALGTGPLGNAAGTALRYYYRHLDVVQGFLVEGSVAPTLAEVYQLPEPELARLHALDEDLSGILLGGEPR